MINETQWRLQDSLFVAVLAAIPLLTSSPSFCILARFIYNTEEVKIRKQKQQLVWPLQMDAWVWRVATVLEELQRTLTCCCLPVFGKQHLINCKLGHAAGVEWKHLQSCGFFPNERSLTWGAKSNGCTCVSLCVHSFMTCCHLRTIKQSSNQLLPLDSRIQGSFIVIIVALTPVLFKFHIKPRQIKKI